MQAACLVYFHNAGIGGFKCNVADLSVLREDGDLKEPVCFLRSGQQCQFRFCQLHFFDVLSHAQLRADGDGGVAFKRRCNGDRSGGKRRYNTVAVNGGDLFI